MATGVAYAKKYVEPGRRRDEQQTVSDWQWEAQAEVNDADSNQLADNRKPSQSTMVCSLRRLSLDAVPGVV